MLVLTNIIEKYFMDSLMYCPDPPSGTKDSLSHLLGMVPTGNLLPKAHLFYEVGCF